MCVLLYACVFVCSMFKHVDMYVYSLYANKHTFFIIHLLMSTSVSEHSVVLFKITVLMLPDINGLNHMTPHENVLHL